MMKQKAIPDNIREQIADIVDQFNQKSSRSDCYYETRFRGKFLYLDRCDYGITTKIGRLTYTGAMDTWKFAIYKWSNEKYDADDWMFPGADKANGSIEGGMLAGLLAYPPEQQPKPVGLVSSLLGKLFGR